VIVAYKYSPKDVIEGKELKTLCMPVKINKNAFLSSRHDALLIMPHPQTFQLQKGLSSEV
jgi:hypothetical protein